MPYSEAPTQLIDEIAQDVDFNNIDPNNLFNKRSRQENGFTRINQHIEDIGFPLNQTDTYYHKERNNNMDGATDYQKWIMSRQGHRASRAAHKAEGAALGKHRANKLYAFNDGSTGYGRYRVRRRYKRYSRYARRYRGRGGFWGDLWSGTKNAFNRVKNIVPAGTFATLGNAIAPGYGGLAGQALSRAVGFGGYSQNLISQNNNDRYRTQSNILDQDTPEVCNPQGSDGSVCIRHREYIGDVNSTGTGFNIPYNIAINPGNPETFPWLSQIAGNFCQYKISGMMFEFVSTSGALSTTQALGEIIMAINYNTADPAFTTKQQMLNEVFAVSKVPSENAICAVESDPRQSVLGQLYIRGNSIPSGQDPRFYDLGSFYLATQGQATAVTLGELWVTYQVELYKPQLIAQDPDPPIALYPTDHLTGLYYTSFFLTTSYQPGGASSPNLQLQSSVIGNNLQLIILDESPLNTVGQIFIITMTMLANGDTVGAEPNYNLPSTISTQDLWGATSQGGIGPLVAGTNTNTCVSQAAFVCNTKHNGAQTITISNTGFSTTSGGNQGWDMIVTAIPNNAVP